MVTIPYLIILILVMISCSMARAARAKNNEHGKCKIFFLLLERTLFTTLINNTIIIY